MRFKEIIAEITRRDFLRGAGAAAGAAVVGKPQAQATTDVEDILSDAAYLSIYLNRYYPSDPRTKKLNDLIGQVLRKNIEYKLMYKDLSASAQTGVGIDPKFNQQQTKEFVGKILQRYPQIIQSLEWLSSIETESKIRLREFAPSPERDDHDDVPKQLLVLANRWWNATDKQPQIENVLRSLGWSIHQVESEDDAVQLQHRDGTTHYISADEFDPDLDEAVNPNLRPGWERREHRGGLDLLASYNEPRGQRVLSILAYDRGGREIGNAHFEVMGDHLESFDTYVRPDMRHQGIATVMYDYAQELGNDLKPSGYQTGAGKKFWRARKQPQAMAEIARIPQGDYGDEGTISGDVPRVKKRPLPGGSGLTYGVNRKDPEFMEIMIFDGDTIAGELDLGATLDPLKTWRVESVVAAPEYKGRGIGKALYGIALSILKLTLETGETQTKHGQRMWIMLNSIPGVEVLGYAMEPTDEYRARPGDHIVSQNNRWTRYTFPVEPGKRSMRSTRRGTGIYSSHYVSMIARWAGA
jgi:GNAT superfamily N-acetyltransferase